MFPIMEDSRKKKNSQVSTAEAFSLWEMLNSKYGFLERIEVWSNFVHDKDLMLFMNLYQADMKEFVNTLEKALSRYGIQGPDNHILTARTTINTDIIRDQLIATDLFIMIQEHIEMLLVAIPSATTNDDIRATLIKMVKKDLDQLNSAIKYFKIKGWLYVPPMYQQNTLISSKIDAAEAFNLWSHLTYRYDNLQLTEIFLAFANDGDFKLFLKAGQKKLLGQTKILEKELRRHGIAIPIKPPVVRPPGNSHTADDDTLFRNIFSGISGALTVHSKAVKQSTTNDAIRTLFRQLLLEELNLLNKTIKFGKMKGWLNAPPSFGVFK